MRSHFVRTRLARLATLATLATLAFTGILAAANVSHADTNPTPIAVPLVGTQGKASVYPSTITVTAVGGQ